MKLVSIVIPTFNQVRYLPEAIESALAQTYPALEVIVIDDGSTDETPALLSTYTDPVIAFRQENRGLAAARNAGWQAAYGDYILFLDSDDRLLPDKVARHVERLEANPSWALDYSAWQNLSQDGSHIFGEAHPRCKGGLLKGLLLRDFFFYASSAVIRKSHIQELGGFDEALRWNEDADFWLRLAKAGHPFGYLDQALLQYRIHPASMTTNVNPQQTQDWLATLDQFFADENLPEDVRALKSQAYAILHFETAGRYFRIGAKTAARQHLEQALGLWQPPDAWLLEWAAGTALDPRTSDADTLLKTIFEHLNFEHLKPGLAHLYRRARGRCHAAALFAAAVRNDHIRPDKNSLYTHWLPAAWYDPAILRNRGFWSLGLKGLKAK